MTPEEHRRLRYQGHARVSQILADAIDTGKLGEEGIESYAGGVADGLRDFLRAYMSDKAAYELLQQAADRVGGRIPAGSRA